MVLASRGRRVSLSDPEHSLILRKASGEIAHRGGLRFDAQSDEYRLLVQWLRSGAKGPSPDAITLTVFPFISISKVLPNVVDCLTPTGEVLAMVKPQFEAGKENVGKGGVVRDPAVRKAAVDQVSDDAAALGLKALGDIENQGDGKSCGTKTDGHKPPDLPGVVESDKGAPGFGHQLQPREERHEGDIFGAAVFPVGQGKDSKIKRS